MTDTPLLGRVGVACPTVGNWRVAQLRWKAVVGGRIVTRREMVGKLTANCGARQWERLLNEAHEAARRKTEALLSGALNPAPATGLQAARDAFLGFVEDTSEPCTLDAYTRVMDGFLAFLAGLPNPPADVAGIEQAHLDGFLAARRQSTPGRPLRDSTLRKELSMLSAFFAKAVAWRWRADSPDCGLVRTPPARLASVPEDSQVFATLADPDPTHRAAFAVLALAGLRNGELTHLPASAWLRERSRLEIPDSGSGRTKLHARTLPIGPTLAAALDLLTLGLPDGAGMIQPERDYTLGRWLAPHGLTPKLLRRWFLASLERAGCPDYTIRALMGHAPDGTRAAYSGFRASDAEEWMLRLDRKVAAVATGSAMLEPYPAAR